MKKLLYLIVMAFPCSAYGQLVEIGVNGGIIPFSQYKAVDQPSVGWELSKDKEQSYSAGGRISLNMRRRTQFGVACEYQSIVQTSTAKGSVNNTSFSFNELENDIATSFITTYAFFNGGWQMPRGYMYLGVSGGYSIANMSNYNVLADNAGNLSPMATEAKAKGFAFGGQLGYVLGIARHFGLSIEVACRYHSLKSDFVKTGIGYSNYEFKNTLLTVPTLIGLRYQIGRNCDEY